jgi:hypothetical protein
VNSSPVDGLPHDIHGLLPYQPTLLDRWPWFLAAGAALVALALLGVWWRRRKGKVHPAKQVDPWDALDERLLALLPPDPFVGRARETYFYELSLALREAIERRTELRATDMTSSELREPLRRKLPLPSAEIDSVLAFLQRADLVKFAEAEASRDEALDAVQRVRRWATALRPRPEMAAEAARAAVQSGAVRPQAVGLPSERAGVGSVSSATTAPRPGRPLRQGPDDAPERRGPP